MTRAGDVKLGNALRYKGLGVPPDRLGAALAWCAIVAQARVTHCVKQAESLGFSRGADNRPDSLGNSGAKVLQFRRKKGRKREARCV